MSHFNTITFEGISEEPKVAIPAGYQGFNWVRHNAVDDSYGGDVYATKGGRAVTSGRYSVKGIGGLGFRMTVASGGKFEVRSAVVAAGKGYVNVDSGEGSMNVTLVGRAAGTEVFRKVLNAGTDYGPGPTEVDIYCSGVDEFAFIGSALEDFDVDNIKVAMTAPMAPKAPSDVTFE